MIQSKHETVYFCPRALFFKKIYFNTTAMQKYVEIKQSIPVNLRNIKYISTCPRSDWRRRKKGGKGKKI